jgi:nicotinamidase-related amidase
MKKILGFYKIIMAMVFALTTLALMGSSSVSAGETTKYSSDSTAILMVDPFNDFLSEGGTLWPLVQEVAEAVNLVPNLKRLAEGARSQGVQIIYTPHRRWREGDYDNWQFSHPQHVGTAKMKLFAAGTWGGEWHPDLTPQPGDEVAKEHWLTAAFPNTDVDYLLRQHGIDHVVVVGLASNTCVESTARFAVEMGYHTTLLTDAVATFSMEEHKAAVNLDYPRIAHNVTTVDEFLASIE